MMNDRDTATTDAGRSVLGTRCSALARVARLARKELREILRDRRTIVTLIAMPVLLYPLMSVVFLQFSLASQPPTKPDSKYRIGVLTEAEDFALQSRLLLGQQALRRVAGKNADPKEAGLLKVAVLREEGEFPPTDEERRWRLDKLTGLMRDGALDLVVVIPELAASPRKLPSTDRVLECQIIALANSPAGAEALIHVERLLAAANEADLKTRLNLPGARPPVTLLTMQRQFVEPTGKDDLIPLSALVPLILILMTITGAVYPAIDLTAGERERGTLEILIAAPVPRFELLTAKYLSVVTVAVLNAVVNLICMTITLKWSGISALLPGIQDLSPTLLLQVLALLLLFAAFFSAVLLCLTSFARGFKEAQAYLIPLMLASLAPGVMAMMPGLKLDRLLASLPLVNIVLLARELFDPKTGVALVSVLIVVGTTLLYAVAALALAARVFGAESVLYSEQSSWADLWRRPDEPQPSASLPAMLWCLALMAPLQFVLFALVRNLGRPDPVVAVALQLAINLLMFGLLPAVFVYLGKVKLRTGLGLSKPRPTAWLGALLLGVSLWPMALQLLEWSVDARHLRERFSAVLENLQETREALGWGVLVVGIVPAILEEIFFRGLLFNALKTRSSAAVTIGVTGLLFGVTHILLDGVLGLERLVPTLVLGLILSAVCWHTGSLWPSMVLHALHNACLIGINPESVPWQWLAASAGGATVGAALIWLGISEPEA
jgi:ABC-2 type transport system permease protein/sodium transport system permease protein